MNKTMKIISTLVIALALVAVLSQTCMATSYGDMINNIDQKAGDSSVDVSTLNSKAGDILKVIRNVAVIAAIIVITVLGIKYMMGSVEERAGYKKTFLPFIVGVILVAASATIATFLFQLID